MAHALLASQKATPTGRKADQFNLFINPKALGLVAWPQTLLATGCPSAPHCLLNQVLKRRLLDSFALLVGSQELPVGMFD